MHGAIRVESVDQVSGRKSPYSDEESEKEDFMAIGREIIKDVSNNPKSCRMGDIYHKIKQTVDKIAKTHKHTRVRNRTMDAVSTRTNNKGWKDDKTSNRKLKLSDSEDSFMSV